MSCAAVPKRRSGRTVNAPAAMSQVVTAGLVPRTPVPSAGQHREIDRADEREGKHPAEQARDGWRRPWLFLEESVDAEREGQGQ